MIYACGTIGNKNEEIVSFTGFSSSRNCSKTFFTWYSVSVLLGFNHFFAFIKCPKGFVWFEKTKQKKTCANVTYLPGGIYKGQGK